MSPKPIHPLRTGVSPRELIVWVLIAVALCGFQYVEFRGPLLSNDAYQYLSVAGNIRAGRFFYTSLVHFDAERRHGIIPAPVTTFPPGYPLAISALNLAGLPRERAAVLVSCGSFVLLVPVLYFFARRFQLTAASTRFLLAGVVGNSWALTFALSVGTESLFTLLSVGALLLVIRLEEQPVAVRMPFTLPLAAGLVLGAAYCVRYAGIFLFLALGIMLLVELRSAGESRVSPLAGCAVVAGILAGSITVRNIALTGSWQGGNTKIALHGLLETLAISTKSAAYLYLGPFAGLRLHPLEVLCWIGALVLVWMAGWFGFRLKGVWRGRPFLFLLIYIAVYMSGMLYLGLFSVISYGPRMFYPLLPVVCLVLAVLLSRAQLQWGASQWRIFRALAVLAAVFYLGEQVRMTLHPWPPAPDRIVAQRLDQATASGDSLRAWLDTHVPDQATLVASDGQATGYVLHRNTVSLIERAFSETKWNEAEVERVMQAYRAEYLLLYPGADAWSAPVQQESPFLKALLHGDVPAWLSVAARNSAAVVYCRVHRELPRAVR